MHYMNLLLTATIVLAVLVIILSYFVFTMYKKLHQLTQGKNAQSLESIISNNNINLKTVQKELDAQKNQILEIKKDSLKNIQNIGVVRFNPFKETGGSQSFAIALTDKNNTGVVISSLYARERINVFAKPIENGSSEYTLSKEEQSAILSAQNN